MKILSPNIAKIINYCKFKISRKNNHYVNQPPWNVLFFGADEFSLYCLKALCQEYKKNNVLKTLEVVTTIRGKMNPVLTYAEKHKLNVHNWPVQIPESAFHIGLVVSFGHLIPESIIDKFPFGMLNVHASLLPRWRGAAPITYALAKGDTETGVTIMQIRPKEFDVGEILMQSRISIPSDMKMPDLHEKLGNLGAECLIECLRTLPECLMNAKPQPKSGVTYAPKITPEFTTVKWEKMSSSHVYDLYRALIGVLPLLSTWNGVSIKLLNIHNCDNCYLTPAECEIAKPGFVKYDKTSKTLKIMCANKTWISVQDIGVFGKKIMSASDFSNGYIKKKPLNERYFV